VVGECSCVADDLAATTPDVLVVIQASGGTDPYLQLRESRIEVPPRRGNSAKVDDLLLILVQCIEDRLG